MSRKPESTFIGSIHKLLPPTVYRMKNHNPFNSGIADCWYSGPRGDLWVEYKFVVVPKRPDTVIDLVGGANPPISRLQQQWLTDRHREGRQVAVIVGCANGGVFFPDTSWDRTYTSRDFAQWLESRSALVGRIQEAVG